MGMVVGFVAWLDGVALVMQSSPTMYRFGRSGVLIYIKCNCTERALDNVWECRRVSTYNSNQSDIERSVTTTQRRTRNRVIITGSVALVGILLPARLKWHSVYTSFSGCGDMICSTISL